MAKTSERRSPIREDESPLPQPGDSLRLEITLRAVKIAAWVFVPAFFLGMLSQTVLFRFMGIVISEWWLVALVVVALAIASWRVRIIEKRVDNLHLGAQGERYVAGILDQLREDGYRIFHDLPGPKQRRKRRGNIDHVIVGPAGIMVIETKTWRKFADRPQSLGYDGKQLFFNGKLLPSHWRDPLLQADRAADWIRDYLARTTAHPSLFVRPVVTFPGWNVTHQNAPFDHHRWALNPRAFVTWLRREPERLSADDVALIADRITRYVRDERTT